MATKPSVGKQLCRALRPVAIEAVIEAEALRQQEYERQCEHARLAVETAQYEADRALEHYDQVDPKYRLVAETLEQRLNDRLVELRAARRRLAEQETSFSPLTDAERALLAELGEDFERVWNHPEADTLLRMQILRAAIEEIVLTDEPSETRVDVVIHWQGGAHTQCRQLVAIVSKLERGEGVRTTPGQVASAILHRVLGLFDWKALVGEMRSEER